MIDEDVKTEDQELGDEVEVDVEEDKTEETTDKAQDSTDEVVEEVEATDEGSEKKPPRQTKFQKRIDELTKRQKEAERQRDEYYRVAQQVLDENKNLRQKASNFGQFGQQEFAQRVEAQVAKAKADYKQAYEEGNADGIIESQQRLMEATNAKQKVGQVKNAVTQVANQQPQVNLVPPPNSKAVEWASRNKWFNQDMIMTNAAYTIHDELFKRGVQPDTDEYYAQIDSRMKAEFPHKFSEAQAEKHRNQSVSNTVVTPAGNNLPNRSRKVRLTPSQVAVANRLGVSLEDYAKEYVALNKG